MCGALIISRKHWSASAQISANGSFATRSAASLRPTASATSTASASKRSSTRLRLARSCSIPPAMRSNASARRRSASVRACASAAFMPAWKPRASAAASVASCSAAATGGATTWAAAEKSWSNMYLAAAAMRPSVHQLFVGAVLGDHDLALGGEVLGEIDQEALRLVDIAQAHRAQRLHVVEQHLGGARRHVLQEEGAHRLVRTLERDRELVLVDVAHQRLRRAVVELDQVVKREHQVLDALGALAIRVLERRHEARFGVAVEAVEDFRH